MNCPIHRVNMEQKFLDLYSFSLHCLISLLFLSPIQSCYIAVCLLFLLVVWMGAQLTLQTFLCEETSGGRPETPGTLVGLPQLLRADGRITDGNDSLVDKCQPQGELLPLCFQYPVHPGKEFSYSWEQWLFMRWPLGGAKVHTL